MKTMNEQAQNEKTKAKSSCCSVEEKASCCEPSAKASCCGQTAEEDAAAEPTKCGCR